MDLVIDGFNLIYKFPELEEMMYANRLNDARKGLLNILVNYSNHKKGNRFYIFFDGKKEKGSVVSEDELGDMKIFYSMDVVADHKIKQFVRFSPNPGNLFVISSDKELMHYAKKFGAKSIRSEEFAETITKEVIPIDELDDKIKQHKVSSEEVDYWKKIFQGKKNDK
jgi:predicted RNA-binding protein with PIN domain